MKLPDRSWLISGLACLSVFLPLGWTLFSIMRMTDGHFMYPLDDPFIHMKLAANLAHHGTWGLYPGVFAGASSSPLYTLLLAAVFKLTGVQMITALWINIAGCLVLIVLLEKLFSQHGITPLWRLFFLILIAWMVPLHTLVLSGMEHIWQSVFALLLLFSVQSYINNIRSILQSCIWAVLLVATRYEGLFLLAPLSAYLLYRKQWIPALKLTISALLPVMVYGFFSMSQGSYFLPNSVLVKADAPHGNWLQYLYHIVVEKLFTGTAVITFIATQRILLIIPFIYLLFHSDNRQRSQIWMVSVFTATVLQLMLAATGWFYRYEAWLIILFLAGFFFFLRDRKITRSHLNPWEWVVLIFLFFPFLLRAGAAWTKAARASVNIYEQQYQMARFIQTSLQGQTLAANDIGAISFYNENRIIDLWGLADINVARAKKEGQWSSAFLQSYIRQQRVKLVMIYDSWFPPDLSLGWTKIATWTIRQNVICGDDTVSFYAVNAEDIPAYLLLMKNFEKSIPATVRIQYHL